MGFAPRKYKQAEGGKRVNSIYASEKIKQEIWPDFISHFKSDSTIASYRADIDEVMNIFQKDFLKLTKKDVEEYFSYLQNKVEDKKLQPITVSKKIKEAHSFADYILVNREKYAVRKTYKDEFAPYLKLIARQEVFVNSVPIEHIDKLYQTAQEDKLAYAIIALLHRMGLSSTEIVELKMENLGIYDDGAYAFIERRKEYSFIPEDVLDIMNSYIEEREENEYLFCNRRGKQLNTMFISRLMKKYTLQAGIPSYSAENIRNTCGVTLFAYGATKQQVARQMGVTKIQIKRYQNLSYRENLLKEANSLVKLKITPP